MENQTNKISSIRVFENTLLERFTHVHPITPLLIWVPFIAYLLYLGWSQHQVSGSISFLLFFSAIFSWSFLEYFLHRYAFHFNAQSKLGKRLVFLFHGLHHDDPHDPTRLVMPPLPAIFFATIFWLFFSLFLSGGKLFIFFAFFMSSYLCYDYIHYATHHFKMKSQWARYLKRHHLAHHFKNPKAYYGVSSPLWDFVFKTLEEKK